jgi:imidazolonepropionase-like amidohydrolase
MRRWSFRILSALVVIVVIFCAIAWVVEIYPRRGSHPPLKLAQGMLVIEHARIYVSPTEPAIEDGTVVVRDGLITAVGHGIDLPAGTAVLPCNRCVVTAGFWNAHVHFTEPKWAMAEWKQAATLNAQLADMFLSRGFSTVVDLGSNPADTFSIRRRVELGELDGPFIYTAGPAIYPPHGIPYYIREDAPKWIQLFMPQPETGEEAQRIVRRNLVSGADLTKLFTGSWVARGHVLPMPLDVAQAAVRATHQEGKVVFAHPSNLPGTRVAIESGVDVLAHVPDDTRGIDKSLFATMVQRHMSMTPTLKMFTTTVTSDPHYMDPMYEEVREFHQLGGTLIFGTDVGYMTDYSTEGEFVSLGKCGLSASDVLAMLTVNPAARMGALKEKGTVEPGKLGDLTILDADPADDLTNFARVRMTIRSGKVVYTRP